jgi:hypothetical protein
MNYNSRKRWNGEWTDSRLISHSIEVMDLRAIVNAHEIDMENIFDGLNNDEKNRGILVDIDFKSNEEYIIPSSGSQELAAHFLSSTSPYLGFYQTSMVQRYESHL